MGITVMETRLVLLRVNYSEGCSCLEITAKNNGGKIVVIGDWINCNYWGYYGCLAMALWGCFAS